MNRRANIKAPNADLSVEKRYLRYESKINENKIIYRRQLIRAGEVAISDVGTKLYAKNGEKYSILVSIKSVPASGAEGGTIEVTELDSAIKQYIADRKDTPAQDFTYNRTAEKYEAVKAVCDGTAKEFLVVFSDGTGTYIKGEAQTWKNEFSAGSAQEATLHIVATEIEDKTSEEVTALIAA